MGAPPCVILRH